MNRRHFLAVAASAMSVPAGAKAFVDTEFSPAEWNSLRQTDETVVLFFRAEWSLTCQIKQDLIASLIAENPAYERLTFVDVDWDTFGPSQMAQKFGVKRRSTLLVTKKGQEIARLENDTRPDRMRALLETAMNA